MQQVEERTQHDVPKFDDTLVVGSRYGTIWLLRAATGEVLWQHVTGEKLGPLIHTGDIIYFPSYVRRPVRKPLELPPDKLPKALAGQPIYVTSYPGYLTALRARDGEVLWRREGWMVHHGSLFVVRDGELLIINNLAPVIGETVISATDMQTGEMRWTCQIDKVEGPTERLLAVRGGRIYILRGRGGPDDYQLHVLDAQTGDEVWSRERVDSQLTLSSGGKLLAVAHRSQHEKTWQRLILNAADGTTIAEMLYDNTLRLLALTDDGIAYLTRHYRGIPRIWAARIDDLAEIWFTRDVEANSVLVTETALYYGHLTQPRALAEVRALDARTGKPLWRWHSPGNILSLLKLWGWRTPQMAAFALSEARRSLVRSREAHDRGVFVREVIQGQWRRPWALIGGIQIAVGGGHVYVVTNLGIFALNASNGRLIWHVLPTRDLSVVTPALPPTPR